MPFLLDVEVYTRFLLATPLLIGAKLIVHRRMRLLVKQFLERLLIPEEAMTRFNAAIASVFRLRNSVLAEVLLFVFVYVIGILIVWRHYIAIEASTWYAMPSVEGVKFSFAGMSSYSSGSRRRSRISLQHRLRLHSAAACAWRVAGRRSRQSHLLCRSKTA